MNQGVNVVIFTEWMGVPYVKGRAAGAYRIATEIRNAGYTCQVIDFFTHLTLEEMIRIEELSIGTDTLVVGFSSTFLEYVDSIKYPWQKDIPSTVTYDMPYHLITIDKWFSRIRKLNPNIKFLLGGTKAEASIGLRLSAAEAFDAFAIGVECDRSTIEYLKFLEGKNPFFQYEKRNDRQIIINADNYPFDFSKSTINWHPSDCRQHGETGVIEISRGCIFRCKFCSFKLNGKQKLDYLKNDDILREEFLRNYYEYGITRYVYCDDTHNDSVEKLRRLHKIVTTLPFKLEYVAYLRLDLICTHPETAQLLLESGIRGAAFGIESLNLATRKAVGKGGHPDKVKETLLWLKNDVWKDKVTITGTFIVGLPHETPESIESTLNWLRQPDNPLDIKVVYPFFISNLSGNGKSELDRNAEKYGYTRLGVKNWSNEHFTYASALKIANEFTSTSYASQLQAHSGFTLLFTPNIGYEIDELAFKKIINKDLEEMIRRSNEYINNYKLRLFEYLENR